MADQRTNPLQTVVDLAVFAPVGLAVVLSQELPKLAAKGKQRLEQQVTVARFVGKFSVDQATKTLKQRFATPPGNSKPTPAQASQPKVTSTVITPTPVPEVSEPLVAEPVVTAAANGTDQHLPIEGYESLAASQIVARLGSLTKNERDLIRIYETARRNRRTVIGKLDQLGTD